jgi:hypothetical protein
MALHVHTFSNTLASRIPEEVDFARYEIDHIIAEQHGGQTVLENLTYAYFDGNKHTGPNIASVDPHTGMRTWLFTPRTDQCDDPCRLNADGTIMGRTAAGRATARVLALNTPDRVQDRAVLIEVGRRSAS